jgi:fructose-1,6-bisphosphatase/inositol monophosphatase family enzyme
MKKEFTPVISLVEQTGELLLSFRDVVSRDQVALGATLKNDGTLVTKADFAANEMLISGLSAIYSEVPVISEEDQHCYELEYPGHYVIIDPLDGTQNYADGLNEFCILVGEVKNGSPIAGVMHFPAIGKTFAVDQLGASYSNSDLISVSQRAVLGKDTVSCRKCYNSLDDRIISSQIDSGFALMMLATGQIDGVVIRMLTHREWDLVAPSALILKAGGTISDESGNAVNYSKPGISFKYFVASNSLCHTELLELVRCLDE